MAAIASDDEPAVTITKTLDRLVAEQVLATGGNVEWWAAGVNSGTARQLSDLPSDSFKLKAINLDGIKRVPPDLVQDIGRLRHIRLLSLQDTNVGDEELANLCNLDSLVNLKLSHSRVTDAGLAPISRLTQLRTLTVDGFSDLGTPTIGKIDHLEELELRGNKVTDIGIKNLAGLKNLRVLRIDGTAITDAGLEPLGHLTNLEQLCLSRTKLNG